MKNNFDNQEKFNKAQIDFNEHKRVSRKKFVITIICIFIVNLAMCYFLLNLKKGKYDNLFNKLYNKIK